MDGLTSFKNEIFKYGIMAAAIIELASLPFMGLDVQFFYGLSLGTAIAIVNFNLMAFTFWMTLEKRKSAIAFIGFLVRLAIYGTAFYMSMRISLISALGTALGFFTLKLALFYLHGFKSEFSKGRVVREEPEELQPKKHWYDFNERDD
ncbi:MAG: ATP synthase subunit I [Eubacteriales bacterium]|nr:ATP synthase subunit I [Eubacteriales bacterium]